MAKSTGEKVTLEVNERNLLNPDKSTLPASDVQTLKTVVDFRPVKVEVEVILPPVDSELKAAAYEKQGQLAVKETVKRYEALLGKALSEALTVVLQKYQEDQSGGKRAYSEAESALEKLHKYVESVMEDFRVDLREAIAKRLGISAKQIMTVGHIGTKESKIKRGTFNSESAIDSTETQADDLSAAFKSKKWQHVGLATTSDIAKIVVDKKKEFKKAELSKTMEKIFDEDERGGLKYSIGMLMAESATNLHFEFLKKSKPGKDPRTFETRLKKGLKEQMKFAGHLEIAAVDKFTADLSPKEQKAKTETPSSTSTTTKTTTTKPTTST